MKVYHLRVYESLPNWIRPSQIILLLYWRTFCLLSSQPNWWKKWEGGPSLSRWVTQLQIFWSGVITIFHYLCPSLEINCRNSDLQTNRRFCIYIIWTIYGKNGWFTMGVLSKRQQIFCISGGRSGLLYWKGRHICGISFTLRRNGVCQWYRDHKNWREGLFQTI